MYGMSMKWVYIGEVLWVTIIISYEVSLSMEVDQCGGGCAFQSRACLMVWWPLARDVLDGSGQPPFCSEQGYIEDVWWWVAPLGAGGVGMCFRAYLRDRLFSDPS